MERDRAHGGGWVEEAMYEMRTMLYARRTMMSSCEMV